MPASVGGCAESFVRAKMAAVKTRAKPRYDVAKLPVSDNASEQNASVFTTTKTHATKTERHSSCSLPKNGETNKKQNKIGLSAFSRSSAALSRPSCTAARDTPSGMPRILRFSILVLFTKLPPGQTSPRAAVKLARPAFSSTLCVSFQ